MTKEQPITYYTKNSLGELFKYIPTTTRSGVPCHRVVYDGRWILNISKMSPEKIARFGEVQITEEEYEDLLLIEELKK